MQRYVSRELTHFVGRKEGTPQGQYRLLIKILTDRWLSHPPHSRQIEGNLRVNRSARLSDNALYMPQMICFCDIPISDFRIHMSKYSRFAVSFRKEFLVGHGANPVFYVARDSLIHVLPDLSGETTESWKRYLNEPLKARRAISRRECFDALQRLVLEHSEQIPTTVHFQVISFLKFFDSGLSEQDESNYYMEREWRLLGNLDFALDDVYRVIIPSAFAKDFRRDVPNYCGQVTFADDYDFPDGRPPNARADTAGCIP